METILFFQSHAHDIEPKRRELDGVLRYARQVGWRVHAVPYGASRKTVRELLSFWHPVGIIVAYAVRRHLFTETALDGTPSVFLCSRKEGMNRFKNLIEYDTDETVRPATRELLSLGMASYAFVHHVEMPYWSSNRAKAFNSMLALNGKSAMTVAPCGGARSQPSYQRAVQSALSGLPRPFGVLAANDRTAEMVLNACTAEGISVPGEAAVVGIDNDVTLCENTHPTLTSVARDYEGGGYQGAQMLHAIITGCETEPAFSTITRTWIVRRASTMHVPATGIDRAVIAAMDRIRLQACAGLRARDVIPLFGCSRRMAEIRFRRATGESIVEAIHDMRLQHAKDLLASGRKDLGAIANRCGFASAASFANFFAKKTGRYPTVWRKTHKPPNQALSASLKDD